MDKFTMNRCIFAAGAAVLVLGVTACAGLPGYSGSTTSRGSSMAPRDMGQMNTQQSPQGETGTSHRMSPGGAASTLGAPSGGNAVIRRSEMGQMGSQQTPQGETGTPHTMGGSTTPQATGSQQTPNSGLKPGEMGQMGTQGTPQGETGTPHRH